ncbi:uroporphyrinogen-III synthase [Thalassobacillus pellis]|uniref:uroporphyrinogen-III synthase n=1 Tax=Thalassobacillus pellis TaxID=748008 RepID=UPI00195FE72F|nr:uroporphyrinogen-III synthase [Thalassobacillus pellis]MBM7551330.1 uroporphyrinogen-III synthase [Thalassobacillus pellis]
MTGLTGKRVGIAADRSADTISTMVEKKGGTPLKYPLQGQRHLNEQTSLNDVRTFLEAPFDWVILTTGIGASTLANEAEKHGLLTAFVEKLAESKLAVRGKKTLQWCKEFSLSPSLTSKDGTMDGLLSDLSAGTTGNLNIFLQAYNQDDIKIKNTLEKDGHTVVLSKPYSYQKPDTKVISRFRQQIIQRSLDAAIFTSKTQVRNLFENVMKTDHLSASFNSHVLAVAVGKVTAQELEQHGIDHVLQPEDAKMGAMVVALDRFYK